MQEQSDAGLVKKYLEGDEKSLEFLIAKYLKPIYSFVFRNVGSNADAEDITQEVFVKVWKNIRKFDQNKNFKPWIFQIAKNASIDFLRKKKTIPFSKFDNNKGQNVLTENIASAPANLIENLSDKRVLAAAMQGLNKKEQKIVGLRHNQGMSFKEIAEYSKESINTVKSRYRRALKNMRKDIRNK
jgi:RNA polymerase sigma-70 factor (ECF subfamily)